jgi:hypothetical protein
VLRKIFGPTKERDGTCRIKTSYVLYKLIKHKNIINYTKAQRLSWFGHLHRMSEERMVKKVYKWKPMLTRPLGRPSGFGGAEVACWPLIPKFGFLKRAIKILSTPSFGREVKLSVPCRRFAAC